MSRSLGDLLPAFRDKVLALMDAAEKAGIPVMPVQTLRTIAEQDALFAQGRTLPGKIVTHARGGQSFHNFGQAVDLVFTDSVTGKLDWDGPWKDLGPLGEAIGLVWGGRWPQGKTDLDHFQVAGTLEEASAAWSAYLAGTQDSPAATSPTGDAAQPQEG